MFRETRVGPIPLDAYVDTVVTMWNIEDTRAEARACRLDENETTRDLHTRLVAGLVSRGIPREDVGSVMWQAFCDVNFIKEEFAYYDR